VPLVFDIKLLFKFIVATMLILIEEFVGTNKRVLHKSNWFATVAWCICLQFGYWCL